MEYNKQIEPSSNSNANDKELDEDAHHEEPGEINYTPTTTNEVF
jgi:hypothetical protein